MEMLDEPVQDEAVKMLNLKQKQSLLQVQQFTKI